MSPEFIPQPGNYSAEDLEQIRARVKAQARANAQARATQAEADQAAAWQAREASQAPHQTPPQTHPGAPRRVSTRTSGQSTVPPSVQVPISREPVRMPRTTHSTPMTPNGVAERPKVIEVDSVRRPLKGRTLAVAGFVAAGLFANQHFGLINLGDIVHDSSETSNSYTGEAGGVSEYGEIELPTVTKAEGLNLENCKKPGSTIASFRLKGNYALRYQVQSEDGTVIPLLPYISAEKGQLSTGKGQNPKDAKFETLSGYPEMVMQDNLVLEVNACQKPNTAAITQEDGVDTVNLANIDFSVNLNFPSEYELPIQNKAYMTDLPKNTLYTWPAQTFLTSNPKLFTNKSVKAAKKAHTSADQQAGAFNAAVRAMVASAADASATSQFNKTVTFVDKDTKTLYDAVKEGLKIRLGNENLNWNGTIDSLTPLLNDKKTTLIDTTGAPEESFTITSGEVIVGQYATPFGEDEGK